MNEKRSETKMNWAVIAAGSLAIAAQICGQLFLKVDLGIDVELVLGAMGLSGGAYAASRSGLKALLPLVQATQEFMNRPQPQPEQAAPQRQAASTIPQPAPRRDSPFDPPAQRRRDGWDL